MILTKKKGKKVFLVDRKTRISSYIIDAKREYMYLINTHKDQFSNINWVF